MDTRIPVDTCNGQHAAITSDGIPIACRDPFCFVAHALARDLMTDPEGDPDRVEPIVRAYLTLCDGRFSSDELSLLDEALESISSRYASTARAARLAALSEKLTRMAKP